MSDESNTASFAKVANIIDEYTIVINKGASQGIKVGANFLIYGIGDEILDPESGESLGNLELVRGIGTAIHVQDKISIIESTKTHKSAPTIRRINKKPNQLNALASLMISRYEHTETVEEISGETRMIPFEDVKVGDFVRPL